jgi:putative ABC transport system permease protein
MRTILTLLRTCLRSSRSHPLRTGLLIFGIALGVAGIIAIDIARISVSKSFELSTQALSSRSTHQVIGSDFSISQSLFTRIRVDAGIQKSAPVISRLVKIPELGGQTFTLMGIDPFSERAFRPVGFKEWGKGGRGFPAAFTQGRGLVISQGLGRAHGLEPESPITLMLGERQVKTRVAGMMAESPRALDKVVMGDIALVQELLGFGDRISRIDLKLDTKVQAEALQSILGPGEILTETRHHHETIRSLSRSFETSLTAFAMLVLFMGIFLIYNTVSFSVASRRPLNSTLRALGATPKEIFTAVQTEVLVYALAGSLLGIVLGIVLGKGAVQVVCATVSQMYYTLTITQTHLSPLSLVKGGGIGILAALASSLVPALNAANTPPITLMQRSSTESALFRSRTWLTTGGWAAAGAAVLLFKQNQMGMGGVFMGVFMIFIAGSFLTPAMIGILTRCFDRLFTPDHGRPGKRITWVRSPFSILPRMAVRNIRRSLSRSSVLIASLMVVISVYIGIDTMTLSFRQSIINWVDGHIGGDIHISSMDELNPELDNTLWQDISAMEGVEKVSAYNIHRRYSARSGEVHIFSYIRDTSVKKWSWLAKEAGDGDDQNLEALLDKGWIIVSEIFARQHGLNPTGDLRAVGSARVVMETLEGEIGFQVAGIFQDFFMGGGRAVVGRETMKRYWGKDDITAIQVFLSPDSLRDKKELIREMMPKIQAMTGDDPMIRIRSGPEIKRGILSVFDNTFLITIALQFLTALVALTGIVNSVMALILERSKELGILRACGAQTAQVKLLILWECGLTGFMAGLLAVPMGLILSWVLVDVVNLRSFGWTYDIQFSFVTLAQALGFSVLAALGAGLVPALRAGKVSVARALQTE